MKKTPTIFNVFDYEHFNKNKNKNKESKMKDKNVKCENCGKMMKFLTEDNIYKCEHCGHTEKNKMLLG